MELEPRDHRLERVASVRHLCGALGRLTALELLPHYPPHLTSYPIAMGGSEVNFGCCGSHIRYSHLTVANCLFQYLSRDALWSWSGVGSGITSAESSGGDATVG